VVIKTKNNIYLNRSLIEKFFYGWKFLYACRDGYSKHWEYFFVKDGNKITLFVNDDSSLDKFIINNNDPHYNKSLNDFIKICKKEYDINLKLNYRYRTDKIKKKMDF